MIEGKGSVLRERRIFSIIRGLRKVESKMFSILLAKDEKNGRTILDGFEEYKHLRAKSFSDIPSEEKSYLA